MYIRRIITLLFIVSSYLMPVSARADAAPSHIVISELSTGTTASSSQEFIELYNPTNHEISLVNWTAEYKSATATNTSASWTKRATLTGNIKSYGFYLIAPKAYFPNADADWSATLAASAGHARIKDSTGYIVDQLGYGATANASEASPAVAPNTGQSIERLPGRLDALSGNGTDTDNNASDFILRPIPEPQTSADPIEMPSSTDVSADPSVDTTDSPDVPDSLQVYAPIRITELLPNPMAPLSDAHDEFIELYNPTNLKVDLTGYELLAGTNFRDHYTLPSMSIDAGSYLALYASQTKLALVNTGGAVQLLDPLGMVIDTTSRYGLAADGQSWSLLDGEWTWTLQTTPGRANEFVNPIISATSSLSSISAKKPKTSVRNVAVQKAKAIPKTKKIASKKQPRAKKLATTKLAAAQVKPPVPVISAAPWLIATLILLTIGYAAYEFRHDLRNHYHQLRSHRRAR